MRLVDIDEVHAFLKSKDPGIASSFMEQFKDVKEVKFEFKKLKADICEYLGIKSIDKKNRRFPFIEAKGYYCNVMRGKTNMSLAEIGFHININHATVLHHLKKGDPVKTTDLDFIDRLNEFKRKYNY